VRTFILSSNKTPADTSITAYLVPRLVTFATNTTTEDPTSARASVTQTLITYATTLPTQKRPVAISLFLPTLLKRASGELQALESDENDTAAAKAEIFKETSARLLELAASDQVAFRGVVAGLTSDQKAFMESVILAGRTAQATDNTDKRDGENKEPTIALRMNCGN
jgi:hypothetical protein